VISRELLGGSVGLKIVGVSLVNTVGKKLFSAWALSTMVFSSLLQKCILGMIYTKSRSEVL